MSDQVNDSAPRGPLPKLTAVNETTRRSEVSTTLAVKHKRKQMGEVSGASQSLHETNGHGQETPDRSYGEEGITPEAQEVLNEYTPPSSQRAAPSLSGSEMTLGQLAEALTPKSEPAPAREPAPAPVRKPRSKASLAGAVLRGMKGR